MGEVLTALPGTQEGGRCGPCTPDSVLCPHLEVEGCPGHACTLFPSGNVTRTVMLSQCDLLTFCNLHCQLSQGWGTGSSPGSLLGGPRLSPRPGPGRAVTLAAQAAPRAPHEPLSAGLSRSRRSERLRAADLALRGTRENPRPPGCRCWAALSGLRARSPRGRAAAPRVRTPPRTRPLGSAAPRDWGLPHHPAAASSAGPRASRTRSRGRGRTQGPRGSASALGAPGRIQ